MSDWSWYYYTSNLIRSYEGCYPVITLKVIVAPSTFRLRSDLLGEFETGNTPILHNAKLIVTSFRSSTFCRNSLLYKSIVPSYLAKLTYIVIYRLIHLALCKCKTKIQYKKPQVAIDSAWVRPKATFENSRCGPCGVRVSNLLIQTCTPAVRAGAPKRKGQISIPHVMHVMCQDGETVAWS